MSFIDHGLAKRAAIQQKNKLVVEQGPKIFDAMWASMSRHIEEAKTKGFSLFTDKIPRGHLVEIHTLAPAASNGKREQFRITLETDKISARGSRQVNFDFQLDGGSDGNVCLKHRDAPIEPEVAVVTVLEQFLFPELH